MRRLTATLVFLLGAGVTMARPIAYWPYSKLVDEADFVAVVEVDSVANADDVLAGHGDTQRFQGKTAHLKVGWVIKGEPAKDVEMLFFTYSAAGQAEANGALFISFDESAKHQYLVFLKREGERLIPVTGHYDAAISVKSIRKDHFSRIKTR